MSVKTSQTAEDYLKAIYEITRQIRRASTTEIAGQMGVKPASVTEMIQKLAGEKPPLLTYQKYYGVELTHEGEQIALEIIRHHRLLETFLLEKLGYTWDEVHAEADRLEHSISEEFEDRMAKALGDPCIDPHGEPIPGRDLSMPDPPVTRLADLQTGSQATVVRIKAGDPELLRYLASIGLVLHSKIKVMSVSPLDGNVALRIDESNTTYTLGLRITEKIFVEASSFGASQPPGKA